jgi:CHAD domain-containing protein
MDRTMRRSPLAGPPRGLKSTILLDDPIPKVVQKILRPLFLTLLATEKGSRKGKDPEKLHDMRVAVRRMRTALRIFGRHLDDDFTPFARELKVLGRTMGPVRDLDVWIANARGFQEDLSLRGRLDLDIAVRRWTSKRAKLHQRTIDYLDSARYRRFKREFSSFLDGPLGEAVHRPSRRGKIRPYVLRDVGPAVFHETLAAVRSYDGWLEGEDVPLRRYHRLRIEVKRLRYTLEFLHDITGPDAQTLVDSLIRLQDHLGEVRETWMTAAALEKLLESDGGREKAMIRHPGIAAYHAYCRSRRDELLESFPAVWSKVCNPEVNRRLAALAAAF